jgi:hypothetical protein
MNAPAHTDRLTADIRRNCDISDARDHGIYSMCTMVLKLRGLYKWEKGLQPWEEPESADLLDWIEEKENFWATIAGEDYRPLAVNGKELDPLAVEEINAGLNGSLHYGAGFGRSMKTVFFLAEKLAERSVEGCPVTILGSEQAREMASPFAMVQDGRIIVRREALRFFLWDQVQEVRSSCRNSLRQALQHYDLLRDGVLDQQRFRESLDTIVDQEMDLFIHHEVGEILQSDLPSATLRQIIDHFPGSVLEFVGRAVKDILADTHPQGLLAWVIRERRPSSLGFYLSFFDGLREKLFPELPEAWRLFSGDGDWRHVEAARSACWLRNRQVAPEIVEAGRMIGHADDDALIARFRKRVLRPLGLDTDDSA